MKVYLDDVREAPEGWVRAYNLSDAIGYLKSGKVTEMSLDHDLGDDSAGSGYDVLTWIEQAVAIYDFRPPTLTIHSANPVGRDRMAVAIDSIYRLYKNKTDRFKQWLSHRSSTEGFQAA